jgi:type VII secretion integral membrane protein EccD
VSVGLARVTISAPQRRVDVALPEHVPLAELLPEVLRHAGEGLADDGERHGGWVLRRTDGTALSGGLGLQTQGVRDGEVLHLVPARAQWPELEYDDVVEAIAEGARRRGAGWTGAHTLVVAIVAAGLGLAVALVAVLRAGPGMAAMLTALGVAATLTLAGVIAARAYGESLAGAALAAYSLPFAFVAGALLVATGDPNGPVPGVAWIGAAELLVGSAALVLHGILGIVGVGAGRRVFAGAVTAGVLGALSALAGFVLSTQGVAAILVTVLVCGVGVLPLLAIRFGKLPMPPVTLPSGPAAAEGFTAAPSGYDAARERPDRGAVFAAVARTEEWLTGMLLGHAVLATVAAVVLVAVGGLAGRVLVGVAAAALLLRSRLFVTVRQRVPLLAGGLAGATVLGGWLAADGGVPAAVAGFLAALVIITAGAAYAKRAPGPYLGRAADLLDTVLVVSVVPVACAVLGLYGQARDLLG